MGVHFHSQFRNPLAYPAGYAPGFDPNHMASKKPMFSGVASAGGFVNILRGQVGVAVNAPVFSLMGHVGSSIEYPGSGATHTHTFSGNSTVKAEAHTVAAVTRMSSMPGSTAVIFSSSGGNAGEQLFVTATTGIIKLSGVSGAGGTSPTIGMEANTPQLIIASNSGSGGVSNYLVMNLLTGVIKTDVQTASTGGNAPDGVYAIGNTTSSPRSLSGRVAAVAFTHSFMSIPELLQWAADPWSFWYPNPGDNWRGAGAAADSGFVFAQAMTPSAARNVMKGY